MEQILVTLAIIAKVLRLSERRVQQLAKSGIIPKAIKGKYDLFPCIEGYIKYLQDIAYGKTAAPQDTHLERARLLKAQADKTEIEVKVLEKSLIPSEEVEAEWGSLVIAFRSRVLAMPSKLAPQVLSLETMQEVEIVLKDEVYSALTELSNPENYDDIAAFQSGEGENDSNVSTSAKANSKPVGGSKQKTKSRSKRRARKVDN